MSLNSGLLLLAAHETNTVNLSSSLVTHPDYSVKLRLCSTGTVGYQWTQGVGNPFFSIKPETIIMSETGKVHEKLAPITWLLGKWRSQDVGKGQYPTIEDFAYIEEAEFIACPGQPIIQFSLCSWNAETKAPMHREVGFIRIKPGTDKIAVMSAHNFGVADIQEGQVKGNEITVKTVGIIRMSFAKDPETKEVLRTFRQVDETLEQVFSMKTAKTPMHEHLRIVYKKVE